MEGLSLLTEPMALLGGSVRLLRAGLWMRLVPAAALPMAAVQWLVEGPRWQLLPAYALVVAFALVGLRRRFVAAGGRTERKARRPMAAGAATVGRGLAALGLAVAVALPMTVPVFRFAAPTGPHAIGTLAYHRVDAARPDVFAADPNVRRQLMVQIWYPAPADPSAPRAAYLPDADAVMTAFARVRARPAFLFRHIGYVSTHARLSAPAAVEQARYPVLASWKALPGFAT